MWASPETRCNSIPAAPAMWSIPIDRASKIWLNIQIHDFERVFFDEFAARLDVFAHERGENVFCRDRVFEFHLQQGTRVRVHRRVPELLGVHFAQALESRDGEVFFGITRFKGLGEMNAEQLWDTTM